MTYGQKLPAKVEKDLDAYIERIKAIKWFKPDPSLKKSDVDTAINASLSAFGVTASIEYRSLRTESDWGAARDAAWDAAWDAARDAAWGACDLLATHTPTYKLDTPFLKLVTLWEMGLYPCGVIDGKFVVYVPDGTTLLDEKTETVSTLPDMLDINGVTYKKI